ncbi:MAG: helix-turn-helix domain-containing protein [Sodalis sp. (in: enterobacteria)]|uniref:helix-turn-helix domain-containing protein n=1 Tax=Sodalis sp. (in: enterobacteria) TaxID=1898979 RepID=UPI003F2DCC10
MLDRNEVNHRDWQRIDIVAFLHKKGITMQDLSRGSGLASSTLKNVLYRPYPKGERIIANALNVDPASIWPSRYMSKVL